MLNSNSIPLKIEYYIAIAKYFRLTSKLLATRFLYPDQILFKKIIKITKFYYILKKVKYSKVGNIYDKKI